MPERKFHLHVENDSELGRVFEADARRVREAIARRPALKGRVRTTIGYDGDVIEAKLGSANAVFCWDLPRDNLAVTAPNLQMIHAHAAGVNHLMPLDWLPKQVSLTNSRGVHGRRATEYAAMAILMLNNRVPEMVTHQRAGRWQQCFNSNIGGKTLLIIGVGHIGGDVAKWAKSMDLRVLGIRRSGKPHRYVDEMHTPDKLRRLLPKADFVMMSAPFTGETILGAAELDRMKPGAGLLNYSRALCVDYDALRTKLTRGEISAILDVFYPEPLPARSPLWKTPNLIITPHCSSDDADYYTPRTLDLVMENIERLLAGRRPKNLVNRTRQY